MHDMKLYENRRPSLEDTSDESCDEDIVDKTRVGTPCDEDIVDKTRVGTPCDEDITCHETVIPCDETRVVHPPWWTQLFAWMSRRRSALCGRVVPTDD